MVKQCDPRKDYVREQVRKKHPHRGNKATERERNKYFYEFYDYLIGTGKKLLPYDEKTFAKLLPLVKAFHKRKREQQRKAAQKKREICDHCNKPRTWTLLNFAGGPSCSHMCDAWEDISGCECSHHNFRK